MSQPVSRRSACRLCGGHDVRLALPMQPSPIGDAFVDADKKDLPQPLFPLDLYQCAACGHVQNLDVVNPDLLFREYLFVTSSSGGLKAHFRKYADDVAASFKLPSGSLLVEIGSNDGTLMRFFKEKGMRVLGVDPAREIAQQATEAGLPTLPDYFSSALAKKITVEQGRAKLVVANNVYAHADDLADITDGVAALLDDDGVFIFEVSYLLDIIDNFLFDTVYHEHLSYHSVQPLAGFFAQHRLHLFDVQRISTKGGSMRCFAQRAGGPQAERPIVGQMIAEERGRGLHGPEIFQRYERQILERKVAVLAYVNEAVRAGRVVVGYGASTTTTTLTYQFELADKLKYIVDDNPRKQGLYSPGSHLKVKPSAVLRDDPPDIVLILAWQYADAIIANNAQYLETGGQFIVPLPNFRVVSRKLPGSK
jgi:SAM-dependent methyltransferase